MPHGKGFLQRQDVDQLLVFFFCGNGEGRGCLVVAAMVVCSSIFDCILLVFCYLYSSQLCIILLSILTYAYGQKNRKCSIEHDNIGGQRNVATYRSRLRKENKCSTKNSLKKFKPPVVCAVVDLFKSFLYQSVVPC